MIGSGPFIAFSGSKGNDITPKRANGMSSNTSLPGCSIHTILRNYSTKTELETFNNRHVVNHDSVRIAEIPKGLTVLIDLCVFLEIVTGSPKTPYQMDTAHVSCLDFRK